MESKPVILIAHGAWHPPVCYDGLKTKLEEAGYTVVVPHLPSVGDSTTVTWRDDTEAILKAALPIFDDGHEVLVVAHSYGGIPATRAIHGHQVEDRAKQNQKGGFKAVLYVAAFCVPKGMSLLAISGDNTTNSVRPFTIIKGPPNSPSVRGALSRQATSFRRERMLIIILPVS